jgi:hypothetical protein
VLIMLTTIGQAVGWAAGAAIIYHVLLLAGFPRGDGVGKVAMTVTFLGLSIGPLLAYHLLFGAPLLGLPRTGLAEWLLENHPDAHALLVTYHPAVDLAVVPLGAVFLGVLWLTRARGLGVRALLAIALLGTSLAIALSLAIHATIVHVRLS